MTTDEQALAHVNDLTAKVSEVTPSAFTYTCRPRRQQRTHVQHRSRSAHIDLRIHDARQSQNNTMNTIQEMLSSIIRHVNEPTALAKSIIPADHATDAVRGRMK
jgi:hypothetical protein